jgi:hypothetical protein
MTDMTFYDDTFNFNPEQLHTATSGETAGELPPPGFYEVRVVSGGFRMDRNDKTLQKLDGKKRPIFAIDRIAIMQPTEFEGSFPIFQDIYASGYLPKNWKTGEIVKNAPPIYEFINCLAAIDKTLPTPDFHDNCLELGRVLSTHPTMTVRLAYKGTDITYAKAQMELGVDQKAAYRSAELKSPAFKLPNGTYAHGITGPSGELVQAKLVIKDFVVNTPDALSRVTLGPLRSRSL